MTRRPGTGHEGPADAANPEDGNAPLGEAPGEGITCPTCAAPNPGDADFCNDCGRPVGATTGLDPLKTIRAEGYLYRQAVGGSPSLLVVVGLWGLVLPTALPLVLDWRNAVSAGDRPAAPILGLVLGLELLAAFYATRNYLRRHRQRTQSATGISDEE